MSESIDGVIKNPTLEDVLGAIQKGAFNCVAAHDYEAEDLLDRLHRALFLADPEAVYELLKLDDPGFEPEPRTCSSCGAPWDEDEELGELGRCSERCGGAYWSKNEAGEVEKTFPNRGRK